MPLDKQIISLIKANHPTIKHLNLCEQKIKDQDLTALVTALKENNYIQTLNLSRNQLSHLEPLTTLTSLKGLDLSHNQLTGAGIQSLVKMDSLEYLILDDNLVGDTGAMFLSYLKNLFVLSARQNRITDTGAHHLAFANIKDLDIRGNLITNDGAEYFEKNQTVLRLDMRDNLISQSHLQETQQTVSKNKSSYTEQRFFPSAPSTSSDKTSHQKINERLKK